LFPAGSFKIDGLGNVRIPPAPDHQKFRHLPANSFKCVKEIRKQDNVAIQVANIVMPGKPLRFAKKIADIFEPGFVSLYIRLMPQSKLSARFCGSLVVAEQNHFYIRVHERPALERIPLNHPVVSPKRLGRCEKSDHPPNQLSPARDTRK